jgi:hypothetical protein
MVSLAFFLVYFPYSEEKERGLCDHIAGSRLVGQLGKLLLVLASSVILGSESHEIHDRILVAHDSGSCATTLYVCLYVCAIFT